MADKYIVYVDESGEANTAAVDKAYPVFVLACCVFDVNTYINDIVPGFQKLKFDWFGHDQVIFHSSDIRRRRGDFQFLEDSAKEKQFSMELSNFIRYADFEIYAETVPKSEKFPGEGAHLYPIAVISSLRRIQMANSTSGTSHSDPAVVFESRGRLQDETVRQALQAMPWSGPTRFSSKASLRPGLQIADLIARPIGLDSLGRGVVNAPFEILREKLR
ncbi:MAG: DUF3800 domain-containing protein [Rhodoluna sp.]